MRRFMVFIFAAIVITGSAAMYAQDISFSGVLDSTINYTAGAGNAPAHSWGLEEYANIRLRLRTGENMVFNAAFNLVAVIGKYEASRLLCI